MYTVYVQVTSLRAGRYGVPTPEGARRSTFLQNAHTGSEANPASYLMGTGGSLSGDKAAGE